MKTTKVEAVLSPESKGSDNPIFIVTSNGKYHHRRIHINIKGWMPHEMHPTTDDGLPIGIKHAKFLVYPETSRTIAKFTIIEI